MTAFFYVLTVLIWSTTWIAIKLQLGTVAPQASIVYRFALAGCVMLAFLVLTRRLQRIPLKHQPFIVLQALCLFSCNFLCFYAATGYIASGIVSVVFSAATVFNIVNGFVFLRRRTTPRVLLGAAFGVAGIAGLFWKTLTGASLDRATATGLALALLGTWFFSAGNLVSLRNQNHGLALASSNGYAMAYGAVIVSLVVLALGVPFSFDSSPTYVASLLYLAIPGSVIGFTTYLTVVRRLGPERAAYMTVLSPGIALTISVFFENYELEFPALVGMACILIGNILVLVKVPERRMARAPA